MLDNPISIIILIFCAALILGAIFSKRVRKISNNQLKELEKQNKNLSDIEKDKKNKSQSKAFMGIEATVIAVLAFFSGTS